MSEKVTELEIAGVISAPGELTEEEITDALLEWLESKGWRFGGRFGG